MMVMVMAMAMAIWFLHKRHMPMRTSRVWPLATRTPTSHSHNSTLACVLVRCVFPLLFAVCCLLFAVVCSLLPICQDLHCCDSNNRARASANLPAEWKPTSRHQNRAALVRLFLCVLVCAGASGGPSKDCMCVCILQVAPAPRMRVSSVCAVLNSP